MYVDPNFTTKKALKEAVKAGDRVTVYRRGLFGGNNNPKNGVIAVEGPHHPDPHEWYAAVTLKDGVIIKVE